MPWRDGTGPRGKGPLTGRALGPCRRGLGRGFGRGRRGYWADEPRPAVERVVLTKEEEKKILEEEKKDLELELTIIEEKLKEMK